MKRTNNYGLKMPELDDNYNVEDFNFNADILDKKIKEIEVGTSKKSIIRAATLYADQWDEDTQEYTLTVNGVDSNTNVEVFPQSVMTPDEYNEMSLACILGGMQSENTIKLKAYGVIPEMDLPIMIMVRGD